MSQSSVDDPLAQQSREFATALRQAFWVVPVGRQDHVLEAMGSVLARAAAGDTAPAARYVDSLLLTGQLYRNPHYLKAVSVADVDRERDVAEALPLEDVLATLKARHGG